MTVVYAVLVNRSSIDKFYPLFEIISVSEMMILSICCSMMPFLFWVTLNAKPLHRNLRFAFITCILQGWTGTISRATLIIAQHFFVDLNDHHILLIVASLVRRSFHSFFVAMLVCITIERFVATFFWSWYEKQSPSTIIVFVAIFTFVEIFAGIMAFQMTFRESQKSESIINYRAFLFSICMLFIIVGGITYAFLLHYNLRELHKLHRKSADFDQYSLSRTYQFKENVVVMKMLFKIAVPLFTSLIPAFVFYVLFIETPKVEEYEFLRMISAAMFDWWIGLICCISGLSYPFFDIRFRLAALKIFRRYRKRRAEISTTSKVPNCTATTEAYFNWLNEDWR